MNKKILVSVLAGVSAIVMLAGFTGGGWRHGGPFNPERAKRAVSFHVDNKLEDLKATDAQKAQVNALKDELFDEALKLKDSNQASKKELMAQWDAQRVDSGRVHQIVDERLDAFRAFAHKVADSAIRLHDLLTPEQRTQLKASMPHRGGAEQ
jgi:Spy/CpxP family protein refolding chaperone